MKITCDISTFKSNVRKYAAASGKSVAGAVHDEAKLLAKRLTELTPPKNKGQGKQRITSDIERVYLKKEWFTDKFAFKSKKLDDRVKQLIRQGNEQKLKTVFESSGKLSRIHIEEFDVSKHKSARDRKGRVKKGWAPFSFPLRQAKAVKDYIKRKVDNAGVAKSGWASCWRQLGGNPAGWINKPKNGRVIASKDGHAITLINQVNYASDVDARCNAVRRAIEGRARDLAKKLKYALQGVKWG